MYTTYMPIQQTPNLPSHRHIDNPRASHGCPPPRVSLARRNIVHGLCRVRGLFHPTPGARAAQRPAPSCQPAPPRTRPLVVAGLGVVGSSWGLSIATVITNLSLTRAAAGFQGWGVVTDKWYRAGLCFSALHFVFGYRSMWLLWTIRKDGNDDEDANKDNVAYMKAWLRMNVWRNVLADLPSWLCYLVAFIIATE